MSPYIWRRVPNKSIILKFRRKTSRGMFCNEILFGVWKSNLVTILRKFLIFVVLSLDVSYKLDSHEKVCILLSFMYQNRAGRMEGRPGGLWYFHRGTISTISRLGTIEGSSSLLLVGFFCFFKVRFKAHFCYIIYMEKVHIVVFILCQPPKYHAINAN